MSSLPTDGTSPVGGGTQATIGQFSAADMDRVLGEGLAIWRQQRVDSNGISKGACASCHSANGLEIGVYNFPDDELRRRARIDGISNPAELEKLVQYFAALRQKYQITALKDVANDRPFQPKGQPLPGATVAERDLKFATQTLATVIPTLLQGTVDTLDKAIQAKAELQASNPLDMQMGIPLPRLSEDCTRGTEHCTANDWIADLPRIPKKGMEAEWFALNDRHLANPSNDNLRAVLAAVETMTDEWVNPGDSGPAQAGRLGTDKFKSVQVLQHFFLRQQLGLFDPSKDLNPLAPVRGLNLKRPNFPFLVGDFAFNKNGAPWERASQMPGFVRTSLGETPTRPLVDADVERIRKAMIQPWWYTGFMFDANLGTGTNREYFFGSLGRDETGGYPFHLLYVVSKHGAIQASRGATTATADPNLALSSAGWQNVGNDDLPRLFQTLQARELYRKAQANWTRMWLYLAKAQLERTGVASFNKTLDIDLNLCASASVWSSARLWANTAAGYDPERATLTLSLYNDVIRLANCPLEPLAATYQAGKGTGLTVEWFAGPGDEFNGKSTALTKSLGSRVEPLVSFPGREDGKGYYAEWTRSIGVDVVNNSAFAARGTGFIQAPVTGEYEFFLEGGFGKLTVDGKEIYNEFRYNEDKPLRATIPLVAGQRYPIRFERHGYAAGGMNLAWRTVDGKLLKQAVPTLQMFPS